MQEYLKGMESFLDVESEVMGAFLNRARTAGAAAPAAASSSPREYPLLGTITSLVPGQELTAIRELSQENDIFLRDHALGGPVSLTSPELRPMVVLPLTMSMEILAEAAAALMPGRVLVGMRDIQAHHWIRVEDTPVSLQISARAVAGSPYEVSVQVRNLADAATQKASMPVIQGTMIFGDAYPAPPTVSPIPLSAERVSRLASTELYDGRLMFHGPCFQGVLSVDRSGKNGVQGQLCTLPTANLFRSNPNPRFVTDPVVLDAAGQLVGFWAAEYFDRGFVVFPYHLEKLRIYGPNRPSGQRLTCRVVLQLQGNEGIRSEIVIAAADGTVWMQLEGWADRRFDPPPQFHQAWIAPQEAMISQPWHTPLAGFHDKAAFECCRLESLFEPGASLWKELWASLVLTRQERKAFRELRGPEHRRMEWLSARTAAKDAMRSFLRRRHGLELLPADIEITHDEHGRPMARGPWTQGLRTVPEISLSHSEGLAVALVGDGGDGRRFGIDVQALRELAPDFETTALTAEERRLLNAVPQSIRAEWLLRLWCVKEAISKALGRGLIGGPGNVRILELNTQTGRVEAMPHGDLAAAVPEASGLKMPAHTAREGAYVLATAMYQKRTQ
jgi:phosphopantetheinyl transferase